MLYRFPLHPECDDCATDWAKKIFREICVRMVSCSHATRISHASNPVIAIACLPWWPQQDAVQAKYMVCHMLFGPLRLFRYPPGNETTRNNAESGRLLQEGGTRAVQRYDQRARQGVYPMIHASLHSAFIGRVERLTMKAAFLHDVDAVIPYRVLSSTGVAGAVSQQGRSARRHCGRAAPLE